MSYIINFYFDISSKVVSTNNTNDLIRTKFTLEENYSLRELHELIRSTFFNRI